MEVARQNLLVRILEKQKRLQVPQKPQDNGKPMTKPVMVKRTQMHHWFWYKHWKIIWLASSSIHYLYAGNLVLQILHAR